MRSYIVVTLKLDPCYRVRSQPAITSRNSWAPVTCSGSETGQPVSTRRPARPRHHLSQPRRSYTCLNEKTRRTSNSRADPILRNQIWFVLWHLAQTRFHRSWALTAHRRRHLQVVRRTACALCGRNYESLNCTPILSPRSNRYFRHWSYSAGPDMCSNIKGTSAGSEANRRRYVA